MTDFETRPAGTADLMKRLLANGLDECDEAATRIEQLEAENKRLGDLYDDTCYYHTPDGSAQFHARKIVALDAALTRANAATAAAYEVAAGVINDRGAVEQENFGLARATQNFFRARNIVRALATPDQTAALDKLIAEAEARVWRRAMQAVDALPEAQSPDVNVGVANAYAAIHTAASKKGGV